VLVSGRDIGWSSNIRCEKGTRLEGADDLGEFDVRSRENLGLDEGETMTAPAVEDIARPTGACFSKCALQSTQMSFPMLCSAVYKDATNN